MLLAAVFIISFFVRFYNFPNRVTFWSEQARSLVVSANYIKEKPSLLGQEYFRVDSNGHKLFTGALFNYSLVPLLLIADYDPVVITVYFALLNIFTGFAVYWVVKKIFNSKLALVSAAFFLFNDLMVYHSLFIWNYNYLPLMGILSAYFAWLYMKIPKKRYVFALGFVSGIGTGLQFLFAPLAFLILIFSVYRSKNKIRDLTVFLLGMVLGNFPMVLFDLRHNFYHFKTLWQYTLDTLKGASDADFSYYYLLPLWPAFAVLAGALFLKITKLNKLFGMLAVILFLYLNLNSQKISFVKPLGMPEGLTVKSLDQASKIISDDASGDFNVSEVLDFDKRAYVLRYYTEFKYGKKPLGEIEYADINSLYVLAEEDYGFEKSGVWEINAGGPYKISNLSSIGAGYAVFKLQK